MKRKTEIRNSFDKSAADYEKYAKVQREIGLRLFERLDYIHLAPRYILDLGSGPGFFSRLLKKKYRQAEVISLDLSLNMLREAKQKQGFRCQWPLVQADMLNMPFASGLFDLVFANQTLHWGTSMAAVLGELSRVMKHEGCLLFSTLGPDTFWELAKAWSSADTHAHTNQFIDMHLWGDALMNECFLDPVMDQERLTAAYACLSELLYSLKKQGVRNTNQARNIGLTGRHAQKAFMQAYEALRTADGDYPLSYEVLYGHAWKGMQRRLSQGSEVLISPSQISRIADSV